MSNPGSSKPDAGTVISPLLSRDGAKAIEFYKSAFGATELFRTDEGSVIARLSVEGAQFWLADESAEHFNFSRESLAGSTVRMVMIVANPDAVFDRAVAAGARVVWPVEDQPYGWRVGRIADPFGAPLGNRQASRRCGGSVSLSRLHPRPA